MYMYLLHRNLAGVFPGRQSQTKLLFSEGNCESNMGKGKPLIVKEVDCNF